MLGAMLTNPSAIPVATDILRGTDFWRETHRQVFDSVCSLYARGSEVDFITVSAELDRQAILEKVGGREFVHALAEGVPAATAVVHYAEIVREQSVLRQLVQVGNEIADMGYRHPDDVHVLLDRAEQLLFAVSQQRRSRDFQSLKEVVGETFQRITTAKDDTARRGVLTGFKDLDEKTEGLRPSNLIVLAARPSMGKTSLALNIAHNTAVQHATRTAIFSLEMSVNELGDRLISSAARVGSHKLRNPKLLSDDDMYKVMQAIGELEQAPIFIDDTAGLTMFELRSKARRLNDKESLGLVIVDYLQLMVGDGRSENRQQEVANISRSLKQLARELEVPVIAVSQLNRAPETRGGESKEPQLSDLRECVAGDTLVTTAGSGERVPIRDLAGECDVPVWTLNDDLIAQQGTMAEVWRTGVRPVQRITLASGREIVTTANHPLLTVDGWAQASHLGPGDHLAVARSIPAPAKGQLSSSEQDVILDRIVRVTPAGETDVYDARVPFTHSFFANDIVSHNSGAIEQDADLVMFLYEKEKGSAAAKGELTLKIAKHRNGATGEITLGWVRDYTKFRTIAKASEFPYEG